MNGHTIGPWFTEATSKIGHFAVTDSAGFTVCAPSPMGAANARLIAAAPAMLAALQRLTHPAADDTDLEHALEVIARATGAA